MCVCTCVSTCRQPEAFRRKEKKWQHFKTKLTPNFEEKPQVAKAVDKKGKWFQNASFLRQQMVLKKMHVICLTAQNTSTPHGLPGRLTKRLLLARDSWYGEPSNAESRKCQKVDLLALCGSASKAFQDLKVKEGLWASSPGTALPQWAKITMEPHGLSIINIRPSSKRSSAKLTTNCIMASRGESPSLPCASLTHKYAQGLKLTSCEGEGGVFPQQRAEL